MAWDFSTEPVFQGELDWMADFVRAEAWPIESVLEELGQARDRKAQWLEPLPAGDLRSASSVTEQDAAGSDPTLLATRERFAELLEGVTSND